jgi:hypothetical protein
MSSLTKYGTFLIHLSVSDTAEYVLIIKIEYPLKGIMLYQSVKYKMCSMSKITNQLS